jgi:hypothetical protein
MESGAPVLGVGRIDSPDEIRRVLLYIMLIIGVVEVGAEVGAKASMDAQVLRLARQLQVGKVWTFSLIVCRAMRNSAG